MGKASDGLFRRIDELVHQLDEMPDQKNRETARALMGAILELQGAGLERMMDIVFETGDAGKAAIRKFAADELISSLLLLHDLHPDDLETRVQRALWKAHANAELVSVFEGTVRLRLTGSGCGLRDSVEALVRDAAPDLVALVIDEAMQAPSNDFVPIASLGLALPEDCLKVAQAPIAALRTLIRPREPEERCDTCGEALGKEHGHTFDPGSRLIRCACESCEILYGSVYRTIPRRVKTLENFVLSDAQWDDLMIPISLAFFSYSSPLKKVVAHYPGPAGAAESLLRLNAWEEICEANPELLY